MLKDEITKRVAEDKESRESRQDMKKPNRRKIEENRRKKVWKDKLERRLAERRIRQDEGYD